MSDAERIQKYQRGWTGGLPETPCGWGSKFKTTQRQRKWIPQIVEKYGIKTIADIGAGDLHWIKETHLPNDVEYTPYDLVPRLPEVRSFDLVKQVPPAVDLIMCLWVLNHFPKKECATAIKNLKASGSKYLLYTYRHQYAPDLPKSHEMPFIEEMKISDEIECYLRLVEL